MKSIKGLEALVYRIQDARYRINHASWIEYIAACFLAIVATFILLGLPGSTAKAQGDEIPFDVSNIFLELNDTDGDLGIHALIDGEPWRMLQIEDPNERQILSVENKGRLGRQGLTELFFESAEPPFDELPPEKFFQRFPEGKYEISGITLEGEELESTDRLKHIIPAPPDNILISGEAAADDCDADPLPSVGEPIVIEWDPVTLSHPEIGTPKSSPRINIVGYQVVVEREEPNLLKFTLDLPPDVTMVVVPEGLFASGDDLKLEVLVREESGNQTAVETCFVME
ncbi:MAG TPA: hypothetical protein VNN20_04035 [Thermodesulfobacteriota bacterium]|nr:hypothetical protein [Thermodesulfobacteriota bacterium]